MNDLIPFDPLLACPGCRFDPDSPVTIAANLAIGVMVVFVFAVLGAFLALIWRLAKGEREMLDSSDS